VQQLQIDMYIEPKRRASMQGNMQKTASYLKRAALQGHGTEFSQISRYRIAERKHKPPNTAKGFVTFIAGYMFRLL